jgi:predicted N-acetyltransferase YhbS
MQMSTEVVQLTAADFDEGLAFMNAVFAAKKPDRFHDFHALLPSIYQPTDELMACNHAVRVNGELRAIVGLFPMDWQVGDVVLKVGGIGGVSTHLAHRDKGYMSLLMNHCVDYMKEQGCHLSYLGGQRQRYGYAGYEKCGQKLQLPVDKRNLKHVFDTPSSLRFEPIAANDAERIAMARELHDAQPVRQLRDPTHFGRFLVSWYNQPFAALDEQGAMVGYLVATRDGSAVYELLADNTDTEVDIARAWVEADAARDSVTFELPPWRYDLVRRFAEIGESPAVHDARNWQIFDWPATVEALMKLGATGGALEDGEVLLGIEEYGTLRIRVVGGEPQAQRVDDAAAVTWHPFTAMRVLFGPFPPTAVTAIPREVAALQAWCPLPLSWQLQDAV